MRLLAFLFVSLLVGGCAPDGPLGMHVGKEKPPAAVEDHIVVHFSPNGGAMAAIVDQINQAQRTIDVQAYIITAPEFAAALKAARLRGVRVRVIIDGKGAGGLYSTMAFFSDGEAPVWRDTKHKEAHNKIVLIDGHIIITGSFNFTDQADVKNAENVLIIRDKPKLFAAYEKYFDEHLAHSEPPSTRPTAQ